MATAAAGQGFGINPTVKNQVLEIFKETKPKIIEKISVDINPVLVDARILQNKKQVEVISNNVISAVIGGIFSAAVSYFAARIEIAAWDWDRREMALLTLLGGIGSIPVFAVALTAIVYNFGVVIENLDLLRGEYAKNSKDLEKCRSLLKDAAFRNFARQFGEEHSPARLIQLGELYAAPNK